MIKFDVIGSTFWMKGVGVSGKNEFANGAKEIHCDLSKAEMIEAAKELLKGANHPYYKGSNENSTPTS